jgi:hypothetical protein
MEFSWSLRLSSHGEFSRKQWESTAFLAASSILSQIPQATIWHTMIATSSVDPWKIDLWFLVRFFHGFALGFAALAQRTHTTAIMGQILSKGISSHVKAMTDVLNKCRPLSNIFLPSGRTTAPGFCMQDCTFCTRPQIHLLLPYAFQKSETVV